jgi:hypothetical protein
MDEWMAHMRRGNFAAAWEVSDRVLRERAGAPCSHWPRHLQYVWDGSSIDDRRVLVRCYHGLGDTIQFIRFASMLKQRAREVIVWAQPRLIPLLRSVDGIDQLVPLHDGDVGLPYDVDVEIMELAHVFRSTVQTLPADVPYIHVTPMPREPAARPAVGLVWRAGDWAEHRSVPFAELEPLIALPVDWYVLQGPPGLEERPARFGRVVGAYDVLDVASAIRALDLVISVDTMVAHLAGALGRPVWTLLHADSDWRWMRDRQDSPWYPTMRLFRQSEAGGWRAVIERVARELERLCASFDPSGSLRLAIDAGLD